MVKNKNAKHLLISKEKRYEESAYFIKRWDVAPTNMKKKKQEQQSSITKIIDNATPFLDQLL
jgi:hypothetical protein